MALERELLAIEERLWTAGAEAYRDTLIAEALLVVPYQVLDKDSTVTAIGAAPRWDDVRFEEPRVVPLGSDSAIVAYRAVGTRGETVYSALVSSTYVRRQGSWLLAFHHQTPLPEQEQ